MPASPRDFLLYSRMTGKPMPENAMERMKMAPEVYQFTKNLTKQPNLLEKTGNLARSIGRGAVMAIGAPMVAEAVAAEADRKEKVDVTGDVQPEIPPALQVEQEKTRRAKMEIEGRENVARIASGVQKVDLNPTTSDNFEQDVVPQQTTDEMGQRSATQQAELETNQTIADNAAQSQDFKPKDPDDELVTFSLTPEGMEGGKPEKIDYTPFIESDYFGKSEVLAPGEAGTESLSSKVDKFLGQSKIDPILLAAMKASGQQEELVGTSFPIASPLSDNPQTPPGQTNTASSQPFAKNIEPIENPSPNMTQQLDTIMNTLRKGRADLSEKQRMDLARKMTEGSPNEVVGEMVNKINQINESSDKLVDVMRGLAGKPTKEQQIEADQANSRILQKTAAKNREKGRINEKFYPTDVARTDIQIGGMKDRKTGLGKSVGISYTPLNGDTKVGFNIMSDPTKPQEVSTFDFVASPKTMESLQSKQEGDLGALAFGKLFNIAKKKQEGFGGMEM